MIEKACSGCPLFTGEPVDLAATEGVAELVVRDLRRLLPRAAQQQLAQAAQGGRGEAAG